MTTSKIDTLVMIIADQNGGKSNQMRTLFEEFELYHQYAGYPSPNMIARKYYIHPEMDLLLRLSSWHEKGDTYSDVKTDIENGYVDQRRRYKVLIPAQVTATKNLAAGEELFIRLHSDFNIRRSFAIWLSPDRSSRAPFRLSTKFANFLSNCRSVSALAIDGLALHPSADPPKHSINARLIADLLFRA